MALFDSETTKSPSVDESGTIQMSSVKESIADANFLNEKSFDGAIENDTTLDEAPLDNSYGWLMTVCAFLINVHTWGINSAWGVFLAHYLMVDTFHGATSLQYALIGGLSISQSLIVAPFVNFAVQKLGSRSTMLIGTVLLSGAMLASSFATQTWHLFLTQGCMSGYGTSFIYVTASIILPEWFSKHRSLALGIASSGAGFGGLAYNLGAGAGIEALGWRWMYRIIFVCTLVFNGICSLLMKERRKQTQQDQDESAFDLHEYLRFETWLIIVWGATSELGYIVLLFSLPNYSISIGLSPQQGSVVAAVLNLGLAFGRPAVGYVSDAFGRINMAALMTGLCGFFCLAIWVPAKTYPVMLIFALLSGTVAGTFWSTVVPVTAEVMGLRRLPSAFAMLCLPLVVPVTFAEPIALQMVASRGYTSAQVFVGCMFLAGAAAAWILRSWKIRDSEQKQIDKTSSRTNSVESNQENYNTEVVMLRPHSWLSTLYMIQKV
ncbi:putative transporter MCH2 [Acrodontium crateriforme]|uniref:Transporter MCH2 n=1 Tax=Acrodontium crateriforme TaxID=150365 RepID=A0AAQ3MAV4_9PEZI|nr:putative transporter MCH2 [Acrodontium crateriforme]